jgi:hypothetical protein
MSGTHTTSIVPRKIAPINRQALRSSAFCSACCILRSCSFIIHIVFSLIGMIAEVGRYAGPYLIEDFSEHFRLSGSNTVGRIAVRTIDVVFSL